MAITIKTPQSAPAATTEADLYTVPASTRAVVTAFSIVNRGGAGGTFRVSIAPLGAATANEQYQYYDEALNATTAVPLKPGWVLKATDKIRVYASTANFSFSATIIEEPA